MVRKADSKLKKIGPQHEAFILNYVARPHSATRAYIDAGFAPDCAKQGACRLLHEPIIQARITELIAAKHKALHMDVDEILARAALHARIDPRALFNEDGTLMPVDQLDEQGAAAIAGFEMTEIVSGTGEKRKVIGSVKKVRLRDPMAALRLLAEHKKLVKNPEEGLNALASAFADRLKAARKRRKEKQP